ncbi:MAG: NAD(P)H-dependent oxidoreductase [Spirochaetes bacterium]|nr:NAD(P)H-dependent oxidoreductase [Spirochaetota bacterium]MBN2771096.1 NAD(P)H-dependent oxidoreductase [Spirochaetota bacterium]
MLIVYAHPNREGHCGEILRAVKSRLNKMNISYELLDLYAMHYDPVLKPEEHYTSGHRDVSKENETIQGLFKNESRFIFIYPTWWNGMPAILKGFFDRLMIPRFAYSYEKTIPVKLLSGKAAVFSSFGGPRVFGKFYAGDRSLKQVSKDILAFCGIRAKCYAIDNARKLTASQSKKIERKVNKALSRLI